MTTEKCNNHLRHETEREALDHLRWARKQPHGKNLRALNVFRCQICDGYHVGRSGLKKQSAPVSNPTPAAKPRTFGEIRRKLRQLENQWDKARRHRAYQLQAIVDADRVCFAAEQTLVEAVVEQRQQQDDVLRELGIQIPPAPNPLRTGL